MVMIVVIILALWGFAGYLIFTYWSSPAAHPRPVSTRKTPLRGYAPGRAVIKRKTKDKLSRSKSRSCESLKAIDLKIENSVPEIVPANSHDVPEPKAENTQIEKVEEPIETSLIDADHVSSKIDAIPPTSRIELVLDSSEVNVTHVAPETDIVSEISKGDILPSSGTEAVLAASEADVDVTDTETDVVHRASLTVVFLSPSEIELHPVTSEEVASTSCEETHVSYDEGVGTGSSEKTETHALSNKETIILHDDANGMTVDAEKEETSSTVTEPETEFCVENNQEGADALNITQDASHPKSGENDHSSVRKDEVIDNTSQSQSNDQLYEGGEEARRLRLLMKRKRYISQLHDLDEYAEEILRLYFSSSAFTEEAAQAHDDNSGTAASGNDCLSENLLGALSLGKLLEHSHSGIIDFGMKTEASMPWFDSNSDISEASYSTAEVNRTHLEIPQQALEEENTQDMVVVRRRLNASGIIHGTSGASDETLQHGKIIRSSDTSSLGSSDDSGIGVEYTERIHLQSQPTIFGTVADDQTPRDNNTKRGLPQTPKSGAKSCPYNGVDRSGHPPEWATTPDDDNSLVYEDGVLVSGSLQALVQHAVPTAVYYPDTAYLFAFLLSSRLFIKPHELLQRICDVGFTQQGLKGNDLSTINKEKLGRFVPHMVQLLGEWSETFPYDFRDERMMGGVRTMTHRCIALEPALRRDVTQVLHNLLNKLTHLEEYETGLAKLSAPPPSDFITQPTDITEVCQSPLVMAQQLTHIELEKLSYIGPEEFVQAFAKDNLDACYKDLKKTNNLESYIQWFNRLSYLVATHACTHVKKKQRVRVIEWWIEVARECFNIGNFNSLMGIIAGLNMSIVSRLKKTWSKVQSAKFSVLEHQMDPSSNFSSYRSTLKAAMWRSAGAVDDRQKIVIPFFSLLVKDLYFLNEGCASRLPNGHINFDKFWQLAKQVTEFMAWKQVTCPFEKVTEVITYMQTTNVLTETGLALASFECEGPENSYEKERYKTLKADTQQQTA